MASFDDYLADQLRDPDIRAGYDAYEARRADGKETLMDKPLERPAPVICPVCGQQAWEWVLTNGDIQCRNVVDGWRGLRQHLSLPKPIP